LKRDSSAIRIRGFGKAIGERVEVLLGKQRRRAKQRDLAAAGNGNIRGPQCDLGLAESDVAADQPVHWLSGRHVAHGRFDRRGLIRRLLEAEPVGEGFEVVLANVERVAFASRSAWRRARASSAAVSRTCFAARAFALSHCPLPSLCSGASSAWAPE
jgi:hypothetical protein